MIIRPRIAKGLAHSMMVVALSAALFVVLLAVYAPGMTSSDGATYATVGRNLAEGRGLTSSVIQPGMIDVGPSGRGGQAYLTQQPLWPIVIAGTFRVMGESETALRVLVGVLYVVVLLETWWLAYLLTRRVWWGYVAWAMVATNPSVIGNTLAFHNVPLQMALVGGAFLAALGRPGWRRATLTGSLLGLACATREPSLFAVLAICWMWYRALDEGTGRRRWVWFGMRNRASVHAAALAIGVLLACTAIPILIEAGRRAKVTGGRANPTLHATFLYYTKAGNPDWYFIYPPPNLQVNPVAYFWDHPAELWHKVSQQFGHVFLRQAAPALLSIFIPCFLPVIWPGLAARAQARTMAQGLLVALAAQIAASTLTLVYVYYFLGLLAPICAVVTAVADGALARMRTVQPFGLRLAFGLVGIYAVSPPAANTAFSLAGRTPVYADCGLTPTHQALLTSFLAEHTRDDSIVVSCMSPLTAWYTRRTILQYAADPRLRISDSPMWKAIGEKVPIDYILLSSLCGERPRAGWKMLPGFRIVDTLDEAGFKAWLYARPGLEGPEVYRR